MRSVSASAFSFYIRSAESVLQRRRHLYPVDLFAQRQKLVYSVNRSGIPLHEVRDG